MLASLVILFDLAWYPDSGPTNPLTHDVSNLQVSQQYSGYKKVHVTKELDLSIVYIRHSSLKVPNSTILHLNNLLYVPTLTKILLSVSKFEKGNNVYFEFYPDICAMKS